MQDSLPPECGAALRAGVKVPQGGAQSPVPRGLRAGPRKPGSTRGPTGVHSRTVPRGLPA